MPVKPIDPQASPAIINEAEAYDVRLQPATDVLAGALYWKVTNVRHLSPDENRGRHNIFLCVLDEDGRRERNSALRVAYTWEGRQPDEEAPPRALDKGDADTGHADIDLYKGQHIEVWIEGDSSPSDSVANLHTNHDVNEQTSDGEDGNTRYHHSFLVTFQRTPAEGASGENVGEPSVVDPVEPEPLPPKPNGVDGAVFVGETDSIIDGSRVKVGERFTKCWVVRNAGETTWGDGYRLVHVDGPSFGAETETIATTRPGQEVRFSVDFHPDEPTYLVKSVWLLANAEGVHFGQPMWAEVVVFDSDADATMPEGDYAPSADQIIHVDAGAGGTAVTAARFWNSYGGLILSESRRLAIDPADAMAVLLTESGGRTFGAGGQMVIRFENHLFQDYWGAQHPEKYAQHFRVDPQNRWHGNGHFWRPNPSGPWLPCHQGNSQEWQLLRFARSLDDSAALRSISMGAPQIMGFNYDRIDYRTPQEMFEAFQADAGAQIRGFFRFVEAENLVEAVRRKDYYRFAYSYNGSGQPDYYANIMRQYAEAFDLLRPASTATAAVPQPASTPIAAASPRGAARAPMPASPQPGVPLAKADPQLYDAWRAHIEQGFKNNETMFKRILEAFMNPYWSTVWMYRILFGVGIAAFVVAAISALFPNLGGETSMATTLIFGGLSVTAFLSFFVSRPLQALEENLQFITWLGIIYNTYWTSLIQSQNPATYNQDVTKATDDAIARIETLMATHAARSSTRPDTEE